MPEPERLLDLGQGLEIWEVDVDGLIEQDVNAHAMPASMFDRLAETIGRDRRLESLPLCAQTDRGVEIISGHHRTRAARSASVPRIHVIVDTTGLDRDAIRAKQLAHNSIFGVDDIQLLAAIYAEIGDVDRRLEAYVPAEIAGEPVTVAVPTIDLDLDYRTVTILFLPHQLDLFERALTAAQGHLTSDVETLHLAQLEIFEQFRAAVDRVRRAYDVRNSGAALAQVGRIVAEAMGEELPERDAVPLFDLFHASTIPADAAAVITQAIERMKAAGEISDRAEWRAIELWAADYNAG